MIVVKTREENIFALTRDAMMIIHFYSILGLASRILCVSLRGSDWCAKGTVLPPMQGGLAVLFAREGTACRAPTGEMKRVVKNTARRSLVWRV
jgi:hypothetical protein